MIGVITWFFFYFFSYNFYDANDYRISNPRTSAGKTIGIHVYSLNIVRNLETINLNWIVDKIPCKSNIKYFILLEEEQIEPADDQFLDIFSMIWSKNVLNAVIIYWNETMSAATFTPFPKMQLQYIDANGPFDVSILFPEKARNLHGHPFRITAFYDISRAVFDRRNPSDMNALDGTDGLLGGLIVERMNATLYMSEPKDGMQIGELFPNGTATGCLNALISGDYDMGLNMRFYRLDQFEGNVEGTLTNGRDDICFLVPRKGILIDIANLFRPFKLSAWCSVGICLPCYVLIFYAFAIRKAKDNDGHRSFQFHFFQFYGYLLQQSVPYATQSRIQRILLIFWIFFVLLVAVMYQSLLSGSVIVPKDQPDIKDIEELGKSNLKIASFSRYNRQITQFFGDPIYQGKHQPLLRKLVNCTITEYNELIGRYDRSYGFANKYHLNMYARRIYLLHSKIYFHAIRQCAVPYLGVYGIRYGTPYKDRIDYIILQAQEGGIMEKWERANLVEPKQASSDGFFPFTLLHLQTAFYVLCIGCVTAIVAFGSEHTFNHYRIKRTQIAR